MDVGAAILGYRAARSLGVYANVIIPARVRMRDAFRRGEFAPLSRGQLARREYILAGRCLGVSSGDNVTRSDTARCFPSIYD